MYHSFLIYSSADGHLGCFHVLAIINSDVMNIGLHVSLSILVSSVCRFLKILQIELPYDPAIPLLGIHTDCRLSKHCPRESPREGMGQAQSKQAEKYIRFENSSYQRIVCVVAGTWNLEQEEEKTTDF